MTDDRTLMAYSQTLYEQHPDPTVIVDCNHNIVWANERYRLWMKSSVSDDVAMNSSLLSFVAPEAAAERLAHALTENKPARLWIEINRQTVELAIVPLPQDTACAVITIKPWQTPNPENLSAEWTAYFNLLHNPFIGTWKLAFQEPIDISQSSRDIADAMFETGVFIDCNETMAEMYRFPDRLSMLGQPVKILYPEKEPTIQRILAMVGNDFKSEMMDSVEVDQMGRPRAFRNAYYGHIEDGRLHWVWGFQLEISEQHHWRLLFEALYNIAHAVNEQVSLSDLYESIRAALKSVVNTTNFYIVLVSGKDGALYAPFNVDETGNQNPPTEKSMAARVISGGEAIQLNHQDVVELAENNIIELEEPYPHSWLGVPLILNDGTVTGALVLQSYNSNEIYTSADLDILRFVSEHVALAIDRKQRHDEVVTIKKRLEALVQNVPEAIYTSGSSLGTTMFMSDEWENWTGVPVSQFSENPDSWKNTIHPDDREQAVAAFLTACEEGHDYLLHYRVIHRETGEVTWLRDQGIRVEEDGLVHYDGLISNVTDYQLTEARLRASLKEKEVLLKEVHHRVKNNLQIVISLLSLQGRKSQSPEAREHLAHSCNRVRSMAMIHERLYKSKNLMHIDFKGYIQSLCQQLYQAYHISESKVKLNLDVDALPLSMDFTVPCGLIVNELLSNALKYAFPDNWMGDAVISVELRELPEGFVELAISDNGIGFAMPEPGKSGESLGLQLVSILVEDQLEGHLHFESSKSGSLFRMKFPWVETTLPSE